MHAVFFAVKRAYYSTLRLTRRGLACMGLTAARFDLMRAIGGTHGVPQRYLHQALGVCRSVVSRMIDRLVELGYAERAPYPMDRRQRRVRLTKLGLKRLSRAERLAIDRGDVHFAIDCALASDDFVRPCSGNRLRGCASWIDEWRCLERMSALEDSLKRLARQFGDTAYLYYPWHPDD